MAIEVKKNLKIDTQNNKFVGIDLPFSKSDGVDGYFKSTSLTVEAVKNNIRMLINTNKGERLMQPTLGLSLERFLFEQINDQTETIIKDDIQQAFLYWLPFVTINDLKIIRNDNNNENQLKINIEFFINNNRNTLDSIDVLIGTLGI